MKPSLPALFAAACLLAGCASSPTTGEVAAEEASVASEAASTVAANADDKQRMRCVTERVTGSNLPKRICMTVAEWDALREASQEVGRGLQAPRGILDET